MKKYTAFPLIIGIILLASAVSATVNCDSIPDKISYTKGTTTSQTISIHCTNSGNNSVSLTKSGSASSYFIMSDNIIGQFPSEKTFILDFDENANEGVYGGIISFSDASTPLNFILEITQLQQQTGCFINPSLVAYTQQIQQGTKFSLSKITFSPLNCPGQLVLTPSAVSIQGGVITNAGQKPIYISSVESDGISINIDTEGLASQTYSSKLKISAFSKQFEIPFNIIITGSTSQTGTFNINNLPKCSLTNNILNINSTYALVCSNLIPNIKIIPRVDLDYIRGINKDETTNQFTWEFQPKKFGNSIIYADFYFDGVPVGDSFSQEVKIASSGSQTPGTMLELLFIPSLEEAKPEELISVQVIDNKSRSLVENPFLYINAVPLEANSRTFKYAFAADKNYSIRAVANGYNDLSLNMGLNSKPINILINPSSGDSDTIFDIKTDVVNATLFIDGSQVINPYSSILPTGTHRIVALKEGYFDKEINITVSEGITASSSGEFKKGVLQTFTLNKNTSWVIYHKKDANAIKEVYVQGQGDRVEFEPTKKGIYSIEANGKLLRDNLTIEGTNWGYKILGLAWYWWGIGIIILIAGFVLIKKRSKNHMHTAVGFGGQVKY